MLRIRKRMDYISFKSKISKVASIIYQGSVVL